MATRELVQLRLESALPTMDRSKLPFETIQQIVRGVYTNLPQHEGYARMLAEHTACYKCGEPLCRSAVDAACPLRNPMNTAHQLTMTGFPQQAFLQWKISSPAMEWMSCCNRCVRRCTSGHAGHPIQIGEGEYYLAKLAIEQGWYAPAFPILGERPEHVIFVGSGPATTGALDTLRMAGIQVTVLEKSDLPFGLISDGIHHTHVDKTLLSWRLQHHKDSGVNFIFGVDVGSDRNPIEFELGKVIVTIDKDRGHKIRGDKLVLALGASVPIDYPSNIPGRNLVGVYPAMTVISDYNRKLVGAPRPNPIIQDGVSYRLSTAGAGLTATDARLMNNEIGDRNGDQFVRKGEISEVRPHWTSPPDAREEIVLFQGGGNVRWGTNVLEFRAKDASDPQKLTHVLAETNGNQIEYPCSLFLIAFGYQGPGKIHDGIVQRLGVECDSRGYILVDGTFQTNRPQVVALGDCSRGGLKPDENLVVHALSDGLRWAEVYLTSLGLRHIIPTIG